MTSTYPVVEVFGPTIQGEGPDVGVRSTFVRFGGCDYRCAWCDSEHAVLPARVREVPRLSTDEILGDILDLAPAPLIVLTGGNPVLHDLSALVRELHATGRRVSVETQGTAWKEWVNDVDQVVVSPKPPSSQMPFRKEVLEAFVRRTTAPTTIKVPCLDSRDVQFAAEVADLFPQIPMFLSVVTLMGGLDGKFAGGVVDSRDTILDRYRAIIESAQGDSRLDRARILPQLHALVWGHERGH